MRYPYRFLTLHIPAFMVMNDHATTSLMKRYNNTMENFMMIGLLKKNSIEYVIVMSDLMDRLFCADLLYF
jgi:hypothetical protein